MNSIDVWIDGYAVDSSKFMLKYEFLDWLLVLDEQESRKIGVEFSNFTHNLPLFDFSWIIGLAKIYEIFTVCYPWYWAISCKFWWMFDMWFGIYDFFIEAALLCSVKIQTMFELL